MRLCEAHFSAFQYRFRFCRLFVFFFSIRKSTLTWPYGYTVVLSFGCPGLLYYIYKPFNYSEQTNWSRDKIRVLRSGHSYWWWFASKINTMFLKNSGQSKFEHSSNLEPVVGIYRTRCNIVPELDSRFCFIFLAVMTERCQRSKTNELVVLRINLAYPKIC